MKSFLTLVNLKPGGRGALVLSSFLSGEEGEYGLNVAAEGELRTNMVGEVEAEVRSRGQQRLPKFLFFEKYLHQ